MHTLELKDGNRIPQIGLGTWLLTGTGCIDSVKEAITLGYRHIDTAMAYGNHKEIGVAIRESGVPRDELFVTTKIPLGKQKPSQVVQMTGQAIADLGIKYIDLLLIHWPDKTVPFLETLGAMGELVEKRRATSVGVSNFNKQIMAEAADASPVPIVTNQVEFHPYLYQQELLEECTKRSIVLTAYSPLGRGCFFSDKTVGTIAEKHGTTAAAVGLAWAMHKGVVVIPKASSRRHLEANLAAANLELDADEVAAIDGIDAYERQVDGPWKHYPLEV